MSHLAAPWIATLPVTHDGFFGKPQATGVPGGLSLPFRAGIVPTDFGRSRGPP